ncbi:MAG: (d)CMP kinase [Candidatus Omnitrophota bacterium]
MGLADERNWASRRAQDKVIAIDGPAGSGKSTVAKLLAKRLGFLYIDTGAMYRALTLKAVRTRTDLEDQDALTRLAQKTQIQLLAQDDTLQVLLDGEDVSKAIREQALTDKVRYVARVGGVRVEMVKLQRALAQETKRAVLEGRDIGTVVFPQARYKFYLDAQAGERAKRRHQELLQLGQKVTLEEIVDDLALRDKNDMEREIAPLVKAEDAIYIDTTELSIEEVVTKIIGLCST